MNLITILRWIHIIAGVAWLGEVATINFVLLPALLKMDMPARGTFIRQVFPRVFRLASVLSLSAILSGAGMFYLTTGFENLPLLLGTRWGIGILVGGLLGLLLTLFHFFVESRLEPIAVTADESSPVDIERIIAVLKVVPRVGLVVIILIVLAMMYAARGL